MKRDNRYEVALASYLRERSISFIAVDEARRTIHGSETIKSADFIIIGPADIRLVVDVKGRKFPGGPPEAPRKVWQNWTTEADITDLLQWCNLLGPEYAGVLAFLYALQPPYTVPTDTTDLYVHQGQEYLIRGVEVQAYRAHMRIRSPKWGTVGLPTAAFRQLVRPLSHFLRPRLGLPA
ncbi:MAG: HYExAFE family protein [Gemmataceae bacterium]